jgi:hypothetical protein
MIVPTAMGPKSVMLARVGAIFLLLASLVAWATWLFYNLSQTTTDPPDGEFGPSFGLILLAIACTAIWWIFAFVGFVMLWLTRHRAAWNLPFLAIALGYVLIAVQVVTNEPARDVLAYAAFTLLCFGGLLGAMHLLWKRPFGLVPCILLALLLLAQFVSAVSSFVLVGSRDETSISYGPSISLGWALVLPGLALLIWPRPKARIALSPNP